MPTKEDFDKLSPADFMDQVEAERAARNYADEPYDPWHVAQRQRRKELWTRTVLFALAVLAFFALVMVWSCAPARAQTQMPCAPHDEMMRYLESHYQEHVVATGATPNGNVMKITAPESGSWSIVVNNPLTGLTCLFAAGEKWQVEPPQEPGRPT